MRKTALRLIGIASSWGASARVLLEDEEGLVVFILVPSVGQHIEVFFRWDGENDMSRDQGEGENSSSVEYLEDISTQEVFDNVTNFFRRVCSQSVVSNPTIIDVKLATSVQPELWDTFTEESLSSVWTARSTVGLVSAATY
ncbi:MAG: hypothetical protein IH855_07285 [Bacteroidetes bacterium]|nr:hypothetical protein [Bacteroidota bacterium]